MFKLRSIFTATFSVIASSLAALSAQSYSWSDCQGSAKPYPEPAECVGHPDSLRAVMINHVGRHGARYAASDSHARTLLKALDDACVQNTITPVGRRLQGLVKRVISMSEGRWGRLDSLGMAEQAGIATRMYRAYPELFHSGVTARASYVPRCVMSMYEFTHALAVERPQLVISDMSGPQNNQLLRFFQDNAEYEAAVSSDAMKDAIKEFEKKNVDMTALRRAVGLNYRFDKDSIKVAMAEYSFLAGLSAIGVEEDVSCYLTSEEYNALWSAFNLKQYLTRTASELTSVPADIARPLLADLINSTDRYIADPEGSVPVMLRFGHAETLMPLFSLMRLPGCYFLTDDLQDVAASWRDFDIVPMAANLQMILFRSATGRYYLRVDLNERPVAVTVGGKAEIYVPWTEARQHFLDLMK